MGPIRELIPPSPIVNKLLGKIWKFIETILKYSILTNTIIQGSGLAKRLEFRYLKVFSWNIIKKLIKIKTYIELIFK